MTRCKAIIYSGMWSDNRQCARNAVRDEFCKQHHPDEIAGRIEKRIKKYQESIKHSACKISGADKLRIALKRCISAAGNPDPAQGCRLVIEICKEALEE